MEMSSAVAIEVDETEIVSPQVDAENEAREEEGPTWLVWLQEALLWPFALASAFAWML